MRWLTERLAAVGMSSSDRSHRQSGATRSCAVICPPRPGGAACSGGDRNGSDQAAAKRGSWRK